MMPCFAESANDFVRILVRVTYILIFKIFVFLENHEVVGVNAPSSFGSFVSDRPFTINSKSQMREFSSSSFFVSYFTTS